MIKINDNFTLLPATYLFSEVARRVSDFKAAHGGERVISMGIGDVTRPICGAAVKGMLESVDRLAHEATFRGYGPERGYAFLREAIAANDYASRGVNVSPDEIFISDGAKSDTGNIGDILSASCRVAVTDPVYPVYVDTNVMAGRAGKLDADGRWSRIVYIPCTASNGYKPELPATVPDVIYLCYPNNPTGTTLTRDELKVWVDYALQHNALILFDSAYEAYISREEVPHSIHEIEGADRCAIEFRSFSKTAGFTGVRCGYTVVPHALKGVSSIGEEYSLNALRNRRQCTKFNGASYVAQCAAAALYTPEGREQVRSTVNYYMRNASLLRQGLTEAGLDCVGGVDAPYIWINTPGGMPSWDFFTLLLERCHVVGTPGVGFGPSGEGCFRLTAFGSHEDTLEAVQRLSRLSGI